MKKSINVFLPLGRLKACSDRFSCFGIALIAPDLINFLATSLASLASAGLLGNIGFSGSGLGAFKACNAFF